MKRLCMSEDEKPKPELEKCKPQLEKVTSEGYGILDNVEKVLELMREQKWDEIPEVLIRQPPP